MTQTLICHLPLAGRMGGGHNEKDIYFPKEYFSRYDA
jgi:hypothetical protein